MDKYNQPATAGLVMAYLIDATHMKREKATVICAAHHDIIAKGIRSGSYAYYVGAQVMAAAGIEPREDFDPDQGRSLGVW